MATHRYVDFNIPEAKTLADLNGIRFDLETVRELCSEISKYMASPSFNSTTFDAIGSALIICYFRCFGYGVRDKLDVSILECLGDDEKKFHNDLKYLRDKHIAHSVNSFEENHVVVYLNPEERGKNINSVSVQHHRLIA